MKWSIAGLILLGLIAAASASMLVVSFQNQASAGPLEVGSEPVERTVEILVAAREIPLRSVVRMEDIEVRPVPYEAAPSNPCSDPVEVVGKVTIVTLAAGQAFTRDAFAGDGSGLHLASALAPGMRAVSVTLSDKMGIEPLLYPGGNVDVIATMKVDSGSGQQPVSITLLESVLVLGIGKQTIVSSDDGERRESSAHDRTTVTLLVTPAQAQKLKLAMEQGSVSLTLRNPMDVTETSEESTHMANLAPVFEAAEARARELRLLETQREREAHALEREQAAARRAQKEIDELKAELARRADEPEVAAQPEEEPRWETTIFKGGVMEVRSFAMDTPKN